MLELNMNSSAEQHDKTSARGEISKLFVVDNAVPMYVQGGKKKNQQCHANRFTDLRRNAVQIFMND